MAFSLKVIPTEWGDLRGSNGESFSEELHATLEALPQVQMRRLGLPIAGYLELHIEQGPSLERENIPIGIVYGIQGTRWLEVTITGRASHAGTTALSFRRDPMMAAVAALKTLFDTVMPKDEEARFTIGRFAVEPGSVNAIPDSVTFTVDLRHPETESLNQLEALIAKTCAEAAASTGCKAESRRFFDMPPAAFPEELLACLDRAAEGQALTTKRMLSGAFHDALFVNRIAPAAMIFVPCRDGLSHNEAEYVEPAHCIAGARMLLASTLEVLASLGGK
jgi:beta-ureidopropionase / N-carbamoyl-L-amino-acid hydrolase